MRPWLVLLTLTACTGGGDKDGEATIELCNGADDNGDGAVDEGYSDMDADGLAD